jgi:two-component system NtrC family response regulator
VPRKCGYILVVDDRKNWRDLLKEILQADGHTVVMASTFDEGRGLLESQHFDVAVFDMRLVDNAVYNIQGMTLLEEAKKLQPSIKAIILTGYPDPDQEARALDFYGADDYLEKAPEGKPFNIERFSRRIFKLLQD